MLVRKLLYNRPRDDVDVVRNLSAAADDRYVDSSTVAVGAKLLEAGAETALVSCYAGFMAQLACSAAVPFTGLLLPCVHCSAGFVGAFFGVSSSCRQGLEVAERPNPKIIYFLFNF